MTNTYKPLSERAKALHGVKVFTAEFTVLEEADQISAGHLEIAPRPYKVLSNNFEAGKQDTVVNLALPIEQEAALVEGGHIKRNDKKG